MPSITRHCDSSIEGNRRMTDTDTELLARLKESTWHSVAMRAAAPDLHRIATEQAAEIERLRGALGALVAMGDNHTPFGGEIYQDRIARAWDDARAALKGTT